MIQWLNLIQMVCDSGECRTIFPGKDRDESYTGKQKKHLRSAAKTAGWINREGKWYCDLCAEGMKGIA